MYSFIVLLFRVSSIERVKRRVVLRGRSGQRNIGRDRP